MFVVIYIVKILVVFYLKKMHVLLKIYLCKQKELLSITLRKKLKIREIKEELDTDIAVGDYLTTIEYDYPAFHLSMQCFWCKIVDGTPVLIEHEAARWLDLDHIDSVDWLPADRTIIDLIRDKMTGQAATEMIQEQKATVEELAKEWQ